MVLRVALDASAALIDDGLSCKQRQGCSCSKCVLHEIAAAGAQAASVGNMELADVLVLDCLRGRGRRGSIRSRSVEARLAKAGTWALDRVFPQAMVTVASPEQTAAAAAAAAATATTATTTTTVVACQTEDS